MSLHTLAQTKPSSFSELLSQRVRRVQASFTYSPTYPTAGQAVQFTDSSKSSPTSWQWSFGDGATSTAQNPSHTFAKSGFYRVSLTVANSAGSRTRSRTITVTPSAGAASFTFSPASPQAGKAVQFNDTSTNSPTAWQWHFGDGTTSSIKNPSHTYGTPSSYNVTLDASNGSGTRSASQTLVVSPVSTPTASFTFSPTSPAAGQAVQFIDTSTGSPSSWQWNFGDGATSTAQNPSHSFANAASYTVTLTAANSSGSQSASRTVTVVPALAASFTFSPASPAAGQAVQFTDTSTGSPTSWRWNFGDGTSSTSQNPSHTYASAASYTVTLTATNSSGSQSVSRTVTVVPALTASFTYSPASPAAGQTVQFTDTSTGSPTSWQWDFGDGTSSTSQNPSHAYAATGSYLVTLTVRTASNLNSTSKTIAVGQSLTASFAYSPASPAVGQTVQFTDTSTGSPTSRQWNFGDGATSTAQNPTHAFTTAGSYSVTLTVTNSTGSKSVSRTITVGAALAASFTYSPASPVAGQAVQFTDTSTGSPTSWQWSFGDGATSTAQNPSHTFATTGSYTVTLTVTGSGSSSTSRTVSVLPASTLMAAFTFSPSVPKTGQAVQFTDKSTGSPTSWQWDFGDKTSSTAQNPSHSYSMAGSYLITLTVGAGADSSSTSQTVTVTNSNAIRAASPSFADVSAAIAAANSGDTVLVPAGTATWNNQLIITKGIYLIGAGIGNTVITSNYSYSGSGLDREAYLICYNPSNPALNEPARISGFELDCARKCRPIQILNDTTYPCNKVRIDHNKVYNGYASYCFGSKGHIWGCVDNNIFDGCYITTDCMDATTWNKFTYDFAQQNATYYEDNTFIGHGGTCILRSEMGAMWVSRYNTYDLRACSDGIYPMNDGHGNRGSAHSSVMGIEIYENTILGSGHTTDMFNPRGGKNLCYNNIATGETMFGALVAEEEYDSDGPGPANNPISGQPQHISDSYFWGNRYNGKAYYAYAGSTLTYPEGRVPTENVHFWNENPAFDGTSGIGIGPLANRPVTCSVGAAYWATDTKTLYKCKATNVWIEYYRPYTYPHPLRTQLSGQGGE